MGVPKLALSPKLLSAWFSSSALDVPVAVSGNTITLFLIRPSAPGRSPVARKREQQLTLQHELLLLAQTPAENIVVGGLQ